MAGTPDATIVSEPVALWRNSATPRTAWARSACARSTWLATNSPAGVRVLPWVRRSTSFTPAARSTSATCLDTAGWLMRSSCAAAEKDRRRAKAANARNRASRSITWDYTSRPFYVFQF